MATNYLVAEVAKICRVTEETVREWLKAGQLVGTKPGRKWLVSKTDLQEFLEKRHG